VIPIICIKGRIQSQFWPYKSTQSCSFCGKKMTLKYPTKESMDDWKSCGMVCEICSFKTSIPKFRNYTFEDSSYIHRFMYIFWDWLFAIDPCFYEFKNKIQGYCWRYTSDEDGNEIDQWKELKEKRKGMKIKWQEI